MSIHISQIIIYVSDMAQSVAFYRDLLGLNLISESPSGANLTQVRSTWRCIGVIKATKCRASEKSLPATQSWFSKSTTWTRLALTFKRAAGLSMAHSTWKD